MLSILVVSESQAAKALGWLKRYWPSYAQENWRFVILPEKAPLSCALLNTVLNQVSQYQQVSFYLACATPQMESHVRHYLAQQLQYLRKMRPAVLKTCSKSSCTSGYTAVFRKFLPCISSFCVSPELNGYSNWRVFQLQRFLEQRLYRLMQVDISTFTEIKTSFLRDIWDRIFAFFLLLLLWPVMLLVCVLVKCFSDRGPCFYHQERVGKLGERFYMTKFRTMKMNAETDGEVIWASYHDSRVTPIGHWLRQTHLDELPQLWQVLQGKMSLIGPRPERPQYVEQLSKQIPGYTLRHLMKPGVTGLAQVKHGYGGSIKETEEKLSYDLYYVQNHNGWLDIYILLLTINQVFLKKGVIKISLFFRKCLRT